MTRKEWLLLLPFLIAGAASLILFALSFLVRIPLFEALGFWGQVAKDIVMIRPYSLVSATTIWSYIIGSLLFWRRQARLTWQSAGFGEEVFNLMMKMRGGKTRLRLLNSLTQPKDRFQLARELGMDWRGIDRQVSILEQFGMIKLHEAFGQTKLYELTESGVALLKLMEKLSPP